MFLGGFLQLLQGRAKVASLNELLEFLVSLRTERGAERGAVGLQAIFCAWILIREQRENLVHRLAQLSGIHWRQGRRPAGGRRFPFLRLQHMFEIGNEITHNFRQLLPTGLNFAGISLLVGCARQRRRGALCCGRPNVACGCFERLHHPLNPCQIALQESLADLFGRVGVLFNEVLKRLEVNLGVGTRAREAVRRSKPFDYGRVQRSSFGWAVTCFIERPADFSNSCGANAEEVGSSSSDGSLESSADAIAWASAAGLAGV